MRYQLVLQFGASSIDDFDQLIGVEEKLIEELKGVASVDGHDFGPSEFNIFVLTNEPAMAFEKAHRLVRDHGQQENLRAAYRELTGESYVILWPSTLAEFNVL
jgi:hypothetical protein